MKTRIWRPAGVCSSSTRVSRASSSRRAPRSVDGSSSARRPDKPEDWPVIIGVVKDVPHNGVEEKSGNPFIYQLFQGGRPAGLTLFLRTDTAGG